jgi:hypothetical protein
MISMAYDMMATCRSGSFGGYFRYFGTTTYLGPSPPIGICRFRSELTIIRFDEKACGQVNTGKQKDSFEPVLTRGLARVVSPNPLQKIHDSKACCWPRVVLIC